MSIYNPHPAWTHDNFTNTRHLARHEHRHSINTERISRFTAHIKHRTRSKAVTWYLAPLPTLFLITARRAVFDAHGNHKLAFAAASRLATNSRADPPFSKKQLFHGIFPVQMRKPLRRSKAISELNTALVTLQANCSTMSATVFCIVHRTRSPTRVASLL